MKKFIRKYQYNLDNNKEEILNLINKSFNQIKPQTMKENFRHCKDIENTYWECEGIVEEFNRS